MLQTYIDESYSGGIFVMAGYIASVERWKAFSDEGSGLLRLGPPVYRRITEFHQVEMVGSEVALEQSALFFRVAERHLDLYVTCSIRIDELKRAHQSIQWPGWLDNVDVLANEYYVCFDQITRGLARYQGRIGLVGPIDFIFDENSNHAKCIEGWTVTKRLSPMEVRRSLGDPPIFRTSESTVALQAADQLAYWQRKSELTTPVYDDAYKIQFPWPVEKKTMQGLCIYCTEDMLRVNFNDTILACALLRAGVRSDVVSAVVSRPQPK